jgi:rRNA maturation endonuclease Nob1
MRYLNGLKYCRTCTKFRKTDSLMCPDCGYRLRRAPQRRTPEHESLIKRI